MGLLKSSFIGFIADDCKTKAAALAYYTLFALPPLLYLLLTVVTMGMSLAYESEEAEARANVLIETNIAELVGNETAVKEIGSVMRSSQNADGVWWKSLISFVAIVTIATGIISAVQKSLNHVWGLSVDPKKISVGDFFRKRLRSFAMIVGLGLLLLLSTVASVFLTAVGAQLKRLTGVESELIHGANLGVGFVLSVFIFASMLKFMPYAKLRWRDILAGAILTSVLFLVGRYALEMYLSRADLAAHVGNAATSLAVVLVWVYYSSMIFLFGAEFTKAWLNKYASGIIPVDGAVRVERTLVRGSEIVAANSAP